MSDEQHLNAYMRRRALEFREALKALAREMRNAQTEARANAVRETQLRFFNLYADDLANVLSVLAKAER